MTDEQIEQYAIRVALGNNGGKWDEHYNTEQKEHWVKFVKSLIEDIKKDKSNE